MAGNFDNTNRGALFDNDRKQSDNHPDMTGKLNIDGVDHWFSGWWKPGRDGKNDFLSLSIGKPVEQSGGGGGGGQQRPAGRHNQQQQRPAPQRSGYNRQAPPARGPARGQPQNPVSEDQQFKEDDIPF